MATEAGSTEMETIVYRCFSCGAILACTPAVIAELATRTARMEQQLSELKGLVKNMKSRID